MAGETIYICERDGGGLVYNNIPFEPGECKKVTERVVDTDANLISSGEQISEPDLRTDNRSLITDDRGVVATLPNPLIPPPDIDAASKANKAALSCPNRASRR